jgi:hypothetical protein
MKRGAWAWFHDVWTCGPKVLIDFLVIYVVENSNKFQKVKFWNEKSVGDMVTFECLPFNSSRRHLLKIQQ